MTNYQAKAELQEKQEAQARLKQTLTEQVTDRHKRDTEEKQYYTNLKMTSFEELTGTDSNRSRKS